MPTACSGPISYKAGYKYQLAEPWTVRTSIINMPASVERYLVLDAAGLLAISAGYAWDGPSGPTFDTPDSLRASLAHDALYQLMREGKLPEEQKTGADLLFRDLLLQDGMAHFRAEAWYEAVSKFAGPAAARQASRVLTAPRP